MGLAPLRSAVVSSPPPPPAAAEPDRVPELPPDALVLTSSDEATWRLEAKEYKALAADPAQQSFVPLLDSFKLQVRDAAGVVASRGESKERQRVLTGAPKAAAPLVFDILCHALAFSTKSRRGWSFSRACVCACRLP